MSATFQKINDDLTTAVKGKQSEVVLALRTIVSDIKNVAIKAGVKDVAEDHAITALAKAVKQREDSFTQFVAANRLDLAEVEKNQLEILKKYLPTQLTIEEIEIVVQNAVKRLTEVHGTLTKKSFGLIFKELTAELKGKADMKLVQPILNKILEA